jgi:hypothetical protein
VPGLGTGHVALAYAVEPQELDRLVRVIRERWGLAALGNRVCASPPPAFSILLSLDERTAMYLDAALLMGVSKHGGHHV